MQSIRCYVRVSTEEQVEEGFSISAQRQRLADFASSQGWVIAGWYIEEGKSAKNLDRPQMTRLREELRPGEIILVHRLDRLTRSVLDLYALLKEWDGRQVGFRSATEVYDTTTAMGRLFLTLVAALAQWERENLGERIKIGYFELVRQGRWPGGYLPFGYMPNAERSRLVPNPEQVPVIKRIFTDYAKGKGARAIAMEINRTGLPTNQGPLWSANTIYAILRNQVYLGHTAWSKKGKGGPLVVLNTHEPIITPEEAAAVQAIVARNAGKHPREIGTRFALSGLARCGLCGNRMNGATQPLYHPKTKARTGVYRYYRCQTMKKLGTCSMPKMNAERTEAAVLANLMAWNDPCRLQSLTIPRPGQDNNQAERLKLTGELRSIHQKKARWYDAYESEAISAQDLKQRTSRLQIREDEIGIRLAEIRAPKVELDMSTVAAQLTNLEWHWQQADVFEQKTMLLTMVESITVHPKYQVAVALKPLRP